MLASWFQWLGGKGVCVCVCDARSKWCNHRHHQSINLRISHRGLFSRFTTNHTCVCVHQSNVFNMRSQIAHRTRIHPLQETTKKVWPSVYRAAFHRATAIRRIGTCLHCPHWQQRAQNTNFFFHVLEALFLDSTTFSILQRLLLFWGNKTTYIIQSSYHI